MMIFKKLFSVAKTLVTLGALSLSLSCLAADPAPKLQVVKVAWGPGVMGFCLCTTRRSLEAFWTQDRYG